MTECTVRRDKASYDIKPIFTTEPARKVYGGQIAYLDAIAHCIGINARMKKLAQLLRILLLKPRLKLP